MDSTIAPAPDTTAARVALWRALHVALDAPPHVLNDEVGLRLLAPAPGWRRRGDMHPQHTRRSRASIVARARFIEDLVAEQAEAGVRQYVSLGAGLDSLAQRRPDLLSRLRVFEIDQPSTQAWKRQRLLDEGFGLPAGLSFVPVDFEAGDDWVQRLQAAGFDRQAPAVVASAGVSMYLSQEAIAATLRQVAAFASGSTFVMSFMLPVELTEPEEQAVLRQVAKGARARGTPFISFFAPHEMLALARDCGFAHARHVSSDELTQRYFAGRADGLRPSSAEQLLVATR
ncbi:class I SAM-dependent methyltransferase [Ideonella sp. BN130291]|uniref:class I SAM-dependent methyltransferase n=1 Tax=Ideonella sp. BN130291 TaxID=3112940 RepID=UPI002E26AB50|nr:class I SAM-dependent methyltransferase [Ideonella sp. BN130291]